MNIKISATKCEKTGNLYVNFGGDGIIPKTSVKAFSNALGSYKDIIDDMYREKPYREIPTSVEMTINDSGIYIERSIRQAKHEWANKEPEELDDNLEETEEANLFLEIKDSEKE